MIFAVSVEKREGPSAASVELGRTAKNASDPSGEQVLLAARRDTICVSDSQDPSYLDLVIR